MTNEKEKQPRSVVTVDSDIMSQLKVLAEKDMRTVTSYVRVVLSNHLKSLEQDA